MTATASPAQIEANRANAKLSTGPTSEEGKRASSVNAIKSGLTSAKIYIRADEQDEFDELLQLLTDQLKPGGIMQCQFFDLILHASWNIRRCMALEAKLESEASPDVDALLNDEDYARKITRLWRYKKMHESTLRQATAEFRKLKTEEFFRVESEIPKGQSVLTDTQKVVAARTRIVTAGDRMRREEIREALDSRFKPIVLPPLKDAA
jgi:hypothetical protein